MEANGTPPVLAAPKRRRNEVSESDIIQGSRNREKSKRLKDNEEAEKAVAKKSRAKKLAPAKATPAPDQATSKKTAPANRKINPKDTDTPPSLPAVAAKRPTRTRPEKKAR